MTEQVKDFIGVFPRVASKEYCEKVIERFDWVQKTRGHGHGGILTRQKNKKNATTYPTAHIDSDMYYFEDEPDSSTFQKNSEILIDYNNITWECYNKYKEKYGFLDSIPYHTMSYSTKIQKYKSGQGYHVWHCDAARRNSSRRLIVSMLYLNTVEEGGETEFLHQSKRVQAKQGTLLLFTPSM